MKGEIRTRPYFPSRYLHNMPDKKVRVINLLWRGSCLVCAQIWTVKTGRFYMMEEETPGLGPGTTCWGQRKMEDMSSGLEGHSHWCLLLWNHKTSVAEGGGHILNFIGSKKFWDAFYIKNRDEIGMCEARELEAFPVDMNSLGKLC